MLKKVRQITFSIDICVEKDGDAYYAHCPALPGVHVDGETPKEALENAKVAVELYIKSLIAHRDPIPIQLIQAVETEEVCHPHQPQSKIPRHPRQVENVLVSV